MSSINAQTLLRRAHAELDSAHRRPSLRDQFLGAHLAALRGAGAAIAIGGAGVGSKRRKLRSAWEQLQELGPQWDPWVSYYVASARTRAALESGQLRDVESDRAADALRVAGEFLVFVEAYVIAFEAEFASLAQAS